MHIKYNIFYKPTFSKTHSILEYENINYILSFNRVKETKKTMTIKAINRLYIL